MVVLFSIAGTLLTLAGLLSLKLVYAMYHNMKISAEIISNCNELLESLYQQQDQALRMMGEEEDGPSGSFGLNQE